MHNPGFTGMSAYQATGVKSARSYACLLGVKMLHSAAPEQTCPHPLLPVPCYPLAPIHKLGVGPCVEVGDGDVVEVPRSAHA